MLQALNGDGACTIANAPPAEKHQGRSDVVYGGRRGHITGSGSVPITELLDWNAGRLASVDGIKAPLEQAGVLATDKVITYRGGGVKTEGCVNAVRSHERGDIRKQSLGMQERSDPADDRTGKRRLN